MKQNKYIGIVMYTVVTLAVASCSDFNDYNKVDINEIESSDFTLWKNISQNDSLKDFANLVKKAGFDDELASSVFYTVWAPLDGTYNYDSIASQDSSLILNRFVKNHVTYYNYGVSGSIDNEHVHSLNKKMFIFNGSGNHYTYDDNVIVKLNIPSINGIIHTMSGSAAFHKNIYEYIYDSEGTDSLKAYFKRFENTYLDESQSVLGPLVNGRQTYIDSVMVTTNRLFSRLGAYINNEDSSFTMFMPTDKAWINTYSRIKPYFNYVSKTMSYNISTTSSTATVAKSIDAHFYTDSMTKKHITSNLVFNNHFRMNKWIVDANAENTDSIQTTTNNYLSKASEILAHTTHLEKMSNGYSRIIDTLSIHPWESWCPDISVAATSSSYRPLAAGCTVSTVHLSETDVNKTKGDYIYSYADFVPTSPKSNPEAYYYLPNVLSAKYNIYCVFVPANISLGSTASSKPYIVNFTLRYCSASGTLASKDFGTKTSDSTKIDTVFVGQFTFPVAYAGLGSYYPDLYLKSKRPVFGTSVKNYDNELRIAAILLRPVEHEEYEEKLK